MFLTRIQDLCPVRFGQDQLKNIISKQYRDKLSILSVDNTIFYVGNISVPDLRWKISNIFILVLQYLGFLH